MPIIIKISKTKPLEVKHAGRRIESLLLSFVRSPEAWGVTLCYSLRGKRGDEMSVSLAAGPRGRPDSSSNRGWVLQQAVLDSSEHPRTGPGEGRGADTHTSILLLVPPVLNGAMPIWTHSGKQFSPDLSLRPFGG